jgi:hypothetical protein
MELRLERLVGRMVSTANHRRLGRIEEIRTERVGGLPTVTAYVLGRLGLVERLGVGFRLLAGRKHISGFVVRWDQLDISEVEHPRLLCPVTELLRE